MFVINRFTFVFDFSKPLTFVNEKNLKKEAVAVFKLVQIYMSDRKAKVMMMVVMMIMVVMVVMMMVMMMVAVFKLVQIYMSKAK